MKAMVKLVPATVEGDSDEYGVFYKEEYKTVEGVFEWILFHMTERKDVADKVAELVNEGYDIEGAIANADLM